MREEVGAWGCLETREALAEPGRGKPRVRLLSAPAAPHLTQVRLQTDMELSPPPTQLVTTVRGHAD